MKLSSKLLLGSVVVLGVAVPMVLKGPDGKAIMNPGDWLPSKDEVLGMARQAAQAGDDLASDSMNSIEQITSSAKGAQTVPNSLDDAPVNLKSDSGKMYKWQDEQGRWHFSSQKPMASRNVALEDLPDVENVMDAPVDDSENGSMMGLPGLGDLGQMLEKVQRASADREQ